MQQMLGISASPIFLPYALTCVILNLNLLGLWIYGGVMRVKSKVATNAEDGALQRVPVSDVDPPAVARVLRSHRNAEATIIPFLFLGLLDVLAGGQVSIALPIFVIFILSRIAHSAIYLGAKQPWRTIAFAVSLLATFALMLGAMQAMLTK